MDYGLFALTLVGFLALGAICFRVDTRSEAFHPNRSLGRIPPPLPTTIPRTYVTTKRLAKVGCATPGNGPILAGRCPDWKRLLWRLAIHCLPSVVSSR